jgi:gamma-glutamylaminecyclotransferase
MYVFVYGTLKKGYGNNQRLLRDTKFIDAGVTLMPYDLRDLGPFPVVVNNKRARVLGEVYDCTKQELKRLDQLEGYPRMYGRKKVLVELNATGHRVQCFMYVGSQGWTASMPRQLHEIKPNENGVCEWQRQS